MCGEARAQQCDLYPIALSAQQLSNVAPGTVLTDIYNGAQPGNFGWLSWGGSPSEPTLVASLTVPGNSSTYVNPDNSSDHQISISDWVSGKPGVSNSKDVRNALDALKSVDINVPVWDQARGSGEHAAYRVANFARIRLLSYQLPGQNRISAKFLGLTTCGQVNLAPVVNAGPDLTTSVHNLPASVSLNGSASDDGLPNGSLTTSWSVLSGAGTVVFSNSNAPVTSATFSAEGLYVLQLSASDGQLTSADTVVITVNRVNQAPQAFAQSIQIDEDTTTNVTLTGIDPDGDPLSLHVVTLPQFGLLSGTPPNLVYTPKPDYNGQDSFTFKVNDGELDSAPATVSITIRPVNDPPIADSISVTNYENASASITLSGSDVEGSPLTFVLLTAPAHGTLDVQPGALNSPQVTYTPPTNYSGNDSFTFKVNDGELDSAVATVSITNVAVNLPPDVDAGPDQIISEPTNTVVLQGVVTDDNFFGYDSVTVEWSKVSGPGTVTFTNAASRTTQASFSQSGVYVLRLTASDGLLESSDDVQVTFNGAPLVSAGDSSTITLPSTVTLNGSASDDGLPVGSMLSVTWEKVSGPGAVVFGDAHSAATTASFNESGVYALRLTADDSLASRSSDVTVTVNHAPIVDAGSDQLITNLQTVLNGTVFDDGLPNASLATLWTQVSGPGVATFEDGSSPSTTVTFSTSGVYVLQLTADDSLAQSSAQVTITIDGAPSVSATSDGPANFPNLVTVTATASDDELPGGSTVTTHWSQVDGPGSVTFADETALQTTASFSDPGTYIVRFSADDSLLSSSTNVTIVVNGAPIVSAGASQLITLPQAATLNGSVTDDGLPNGTLVLNWSKVSGLGAVSFADPSASATTASFMGSGVYVLRLTANDGLATSTSDVTITVNARPSVTVNADNLTPRLPQTASLVGTVSDDGLPYGTLAYAWTWVSGPGTVTFSNPTSPNTTATFSQAGSYTLRLTADDGAATVSADITITVLPENHAPVVDAGANQTVNFPDIMILHGAVTDDGVPIGSLNIAWSQLSGPGTITFGDIHSATTSASASSGGVYVLRLTGDDTLATNSADVTVKFNRAPVAQSQSLNAPEGQATPITLLGTDPDGDSLQFVVTQQPHLGLLGGSGSNISYTANVGTYGADTFAFYVTDGMLTSAVATVSLQVVPFGRGRTYTSNNDFNQGTLTSLVATNDQLQTVVDLTQFNYVWVPVQSRGTIVRLDSDTGRPLGEYRLYPDGLSNAFPSRIAVDSRGNCWVANERDNSVLEIATPESDWVDKNHNGVLDTSQGQGDIRPWTNPLGVDSNGGTTTAQDELIVQYVRTTDTGARFLAVNRNDDVWVGGTQQQVFDFIDHTSGRIVRSEPSIGRGGFGGFIDQDDVLWSAGTFLRWDTHQHLSTAATSWTNVPDGSFFCAKDPSGNLWVTYEYGRTVLKYDSTGTKIGEYPNGSRYGQGIAIDSNGDVWIAHSHCGYSVGHLKNDGTLVGVVPTAHGPTAVAFDRKGRLWVSTTTGVVQRINTLGGAIGKDGVTPVGIVELTSPSLDGYLWTYGDFTGSSSTFQTARGLWTVVFDSGLSNAAWAGLSWDALIANDGDLQVSVATSDNGTTFSPLQPITLESSQPTNTGRYLQVVVNFVPATSGEGPTLQDMNVGTVGWPVPPAIQQWNVSGGGNVNAYWPDAVQIKGVVLRSAHKIAVNPTIQWSMISGPGTVTFDNPTIIQPTVHFSTNGTYVFRVTANNNGDIKSNDITVSMTPYNRAPWADAGPNLFVQDSATGVATLQGTVQDDGMPVNKTLKIQWVQLFGPGTTTFANSNNAVTSATFSTNGIYVLQLSGDDGEFVSKATVTVRVGTICTVSDVPNLEAWWQANATGDDHANGNEAFLVNGANYVQGKVGPAFNFDGNNAQVSVGANPHIDLTKVSNPGFTLEFWINPGSFLTGGVMGWPSGLRIERFTSGTTSVGDSLHFYLAGTNSGQFVDASRIWPGTSSTNQWFHIALTYDRPSTVAKVFLNGVLLTSGTVGSNLLSTSTEFYMGKIPGSAGAFKGQLDEISLYSRALDPEEIYNIFASGGAGKCPLEGNQAPTVDAGPDLFLRGIPATATLNGQVFDDGLPVGSSIRIQWTKLNGPGTVTFGSPNAAVTSATFSTNGIYVLQLAADDGDVQTTSLVEVRVESVCTIDDPQGLAAWWPGNNTDIEVLNGYDAIQGSGETYTTGKVASAFSFNGINNYVWMLAQSNYDVGPSPAGFTLEFWVNPLGFQNGSVLGWANGVRVERFSGGVVTGDSLHFYVGGTNSGQFVDAVRIWPGTQFTNVWCHLAFTYDRTVGQAKIYTNGVLVATGTVGANVMSTAGDFYLGQVPGSSNFFNGALDEISVYKRPLNPEEIYNVFASGSVGKCPHDSNQPPTVNAGGDLFVRGVPGIVTLQGQVSDDGLPTGSTLRTQWSKLSGPGTVTFADSNAPVATATFSTNGVYVLKLTADDSEVQANDLVEVRVESLCTIDNVQGLAAWWPGNGSSDDVVNGYHGILGNGTTYTNGEVGSAFLFNGANNYVWMSAQSNYNVGSSAAGFTLEFWINPTMLQNGSVLGWANGVRIERFSGGSATGDSLHFYVAGTNSGQFIDAVRIWPGTQFTNRFYHVAMTYDRTLGQAKIYTNGVLVTNGIVGTNVMSTAGDFYLGQVPGSTGVIGSVLDEVSIYKRPLTSEEVSSVFASGSTGKCPEDQNQPPVVFAGNDIILLSTNTAATLNGFVSDDGLPAGSTLRTQWSRFAGPGVVTFNNSNAITTTATFSTNGVYVLQLTADDGEAKSTSLMQVRVGVACSVTDPSGLVGFWPANGTSDDLITGSHAYLGNGTTYTNGRVGAAFSFNGANNYLWIPTQTNYNLGPGASGFTAEFWVNPNTFQNGSVLGWANGVRLERWVAGSAQGDSLRFFVTGTNSGQYVDVQRIWPGSATLNQWYHIALTYDRTLGQAKIYTNGVLQTTGTVGTNVMSTAGDFYLGQVPGSSSFFSGGIDELSLYNRTLALSDVQAIFNGGASGKCITPKNQPPYVTAGGNRTIYFPTNTIMLPGAAYDDGLPSNSLAVAWIYLSGPATIFFNSTNTPITTITFTNTGVYTFQLTASDGQYTTNDTAIVTVLPDPRIPPTIAITSPSNGDSFEVANASATTNITIAASASDSDGTVARVDIYQDNTLIGTLTNIPYSVTASNVPVGQHTFTAVATDNDGLATTSAPVVVSVYVDDLPTAIIFTPDDAASVTAPTNIIATATSPILQSYQLRYRFKAPEDVQPNPWITLKTGGSPVLSNTLAVFDPTLLLNGIYEMQLTVTDTKGRSTSTDFVTLLVSRNLKVGNFTLSFSDLNVPLAGVPIQIVRTYDSRDQRTNDFGIGWSLDIGNIRLQKTRNLGANWFSTFETPFYSLDSVQPRRITVTLAGDKAYEFESVLTPSEQFGAPIESTRMTFTNLPSTYGTLEIDGDNKADVAGSIGFINLIDISTTDYFNPTRFKFTTAEGDVYIIDEKEGLKRMTDRNGNTLTITTNGIFHSSGVSVTFTRDLQGRITAITDPAGNSLVYSYGTNGCLASVTDREAMTTTFAYTNTTFPHYLTEITDPRGVKAIRTEFDDGGRMVRQIDGAGNVINFTHDLAHNREVIVDRLGNPTIHEYDDRGNVIRTTDALGGVTTHVYDDVDNELQKVDALGNTNSYTYDANGNKLTETDPLGFTTRYSYGPFRVLTSITNPRGFTSTNSYDSDTGNLLQQTDALGNVTSYSYDDAGNLLTRTDALGNITTNGYDSVGHLTNTVVIDAVRGVLNSTGYTYDTNGNQISKSIKRTTPGGVQTLITQYRYDNNNRLLQTIYPDGSGNTTVYALGLDKPASETDALGHQTLHFYDERGNMTNTVFADATSEATVYDSENRKIAMIDRGGRSMFYTNDPLGRLTAIQLPDGAVTNTYYDAIGRIIATQDERSNVTRYAYDPNCGCSGRQAYITNALGQVTHREYDENANESAMTDALGRTTSYIYDELDRRSRVIYPDGTFTVTTYDALGRRIAEIDQNTNTTWFGYDALSRLVAVTNALDKVTSYAYDEQGSLVAQTDANGHTTRFEYDSVGRRTKRTLPLGQFETYHYDLVGNLTSKVDFNGHTTTYAYDPVNRLLSKTPDQFFSAPPVTFTYTPTGQRATMTDAAGSTTYGYDSRDFLTNKTWTPAGYSFNLALNYSYNPHGDVTRIYSTSVNGVDLTYGYDALNRLGSVTDTHTGTTTYGYDDVGNLAGYTYPNGLTSTYQYDALNRLTNLSTLNSQLSTVANYRYTVAPTGHRLTASESLATTNGVRTINRVYAYDATYRLINEFYNVSGPVDLPSSTSVGYSLDDVGNRLTRTSNLPGVQNQTLSYDADDRLTTDIYDSNGNTVAGHVTSSTPAVSDQYDFEDHLISRNNGQITITYEGDGNRLTKTVNGNTTFYLVDDRNPTGYEQVLEELTTTSSFTPTVARIYVYGSALISQQLRLTLDPQLIIFFYGQDGHGNVRFLTSAIGELTDTYDYDAYGTLISQTGVTPNSHLYCGEQFDAEVGLYYNRARYLNCDLGRFWSADKVDPALKDPITIHRYVYGGVNPVTLIDPSGFITVNELLESIGIDKQVRESVTQLVKRQTIKKFEGFVCQELKDQVVQGVYAIVLDGTVYVGQSKNLAQRLKQWEKEGAQFLGAIKTVTGMDGDRAQKFVRELIEQVGVDVAGGAGRGAQKNNPISLSNLEERIKKYDPVNQLATATFKLIPVCQDVKP